MKCPKCGYLRQAKDNAFIPGNECPSCGIVYTKHEKPGHYKRKGSPAPPLRNPSPVSASSLQKARERIDRRLRKNQAARVPDFRHAQTLEMARRLTAEGVRQRQSEWEKRNRKETSGSDVSDGAAVKQVEPKPSDHPPVEAAPKKRGKQLTTTFAKALNKKKIVPKQPSESTVQSVPSQKTESTSPAKNSPPAVDNTPSFDEAQIQASHQQPDNEEGKAFMKPIQLFQSKGGGYSSSKTKPPSLKEMLKDYDPPNPEQIVTARVFDVFRNIQVGGLMGLLPLVAWLILGAGVIGTILSWTTLGDVHAAVQPTTPSGTSTLPLGLLLGFAYLATGVLGFAFFWVSSLISRQLKDIRRLLLLHPASQVEPEINQDHGAE